jgi:hypothetical protein
MNHTFERFVLAPMVTVIVAIVGWSLINIIELKEDVAEVKTDIKYITKQVDVISERIAGLDELKEFGIIVKDVYATK